MKILLLPNALKGSLTSQKFIQIAQKTLAPKKYTLRAFAISDGGDGFLDSFRTLAPNARTYYTLAQNALGKAKRVPYLLLPDQKTAVIETAKICGLAEIAPHQLNPLEASSYGVGQVILSAIKRGAKTIYIGLGGVACNDGGAGMAAACGAKLTDQNGDELPLGAKALLQLHKVDLFLLKKQTRNVKFIGVSDVLNPLLGPHSSAKVFGPQKGATATQVKLLDKAMRIWAQTLKRATGQKISHVPSTAAAGAIAAGLYGCFAGKLVLGAEEIFKKARLETHFRWADLIITSEGKLDTQTFYGKAPLAVLKFAQKYKKPVLFICGQADWKSLGKQNLSGVCVAELVDFAPSLKKSQKCAGTYVAQILKNTLI